VRGALGTLMVYVLGPDMEARGLEPDALLEGVEIVSYAGFVDLSVAHDRVLSWP